MVETHPQLDRRDDEVRPRGAPGKPERLRDTWPIKWRDAGLLLACYVVLTGVWSNAWVKSSRVVASAVRA